MSLFPDVDENIDVWSFLLLGILQLGVYVSGGVGGGDVEGPIRLCLPHQLHP